MSLWRLASKKHFDGKHPIKISATGISYHTRKLRSIVLAPSLTLLSQSVTHGKFTRDLPTALSPSDMIRQPKGTLQYFYRSLWHYCQRAFLRPSTHVVSHDAARHGKISFTCGTYMIPRRKAYYNTFEPDFDNNVNSRKNTLKLHITQTKHIKYENKKQNIKKTKNIEECKI